MSASEETPGLSLDAWSRGLRTRRARLPHDIAIFVALTCCERCEQNPRILSMRAVAIAHDGEITIDPDTVVADDVTSARSIVQLLAALLLAAGPGIPASVLTLVERGSSEPWTLAHLHDALEVLLVPINRGASRRVLARSLREVRRDSTAPPADVSVIPNAEELDADMDALLASEIWNDAAAEDPSALGDPTPIDLNAVHDLEENDDP